MPRVADSKRCLQLKRASDIILLRWFALRIEYDKEADALYIQLREATVDDNIDIEEGVTVDLDEKRHIVGIEILDASKKLSLEDLANITIHNLPVEKIESIGSQNL